MTVIQSIGKVPSAAVAFHGDEQQTGRAFVAQVLATGALVLGNHFFGSRFPKCCSNPLLLAGGALVVDGLLRTRPISTLRAKAISDKSTQTYLTPLALAVSNFALFSAFKGGFRGNFLKVGGTAAIAAFHRLTPVYSPVLLAMLPEPSRDGGA